MNNEEKPVLTQAQYKQIKWEKRQKIKALKEEQEADLQAKKAQEEKTRQEKYMKEAIKQAKKALAIQEVPIGCVIVYQEKIIARGYNKRVKYNSVLAHAEIEAIKKAAKVLRDWRLEGCELYVTLEPCQMCAGAIVQARIPRVIMGAMNPKAGSAGSLVDLFHIQEFNHQVDSEKGILAKECEELLTAFFEQLRGTKEGEQGIGK